MSIVKGTRQKQAAATRQRIVDTAYALFCELGYRATTMALIAERARVAVQTVYFIFRTKDALLQEVHDQTVLGPGTPVVPPEQPWYVSMAGDSDPVRAISTLVGGTSTILARVAPMLSVFQSVMGDQVGEIYQRSEALRREGMHEVATILLTKAEPRLGLTPRQAGDLLVALLGPELYRTFVLELGWTQDQWVDWTTKVVVGELFAGQ